MNQKKLNITQNIPKTCLSREHFRIIFFLIYYILLKYKYIFKLDKESKSCSFIVIILSFFFYTYLTKTHLIKNFTIQNKIIFLKELVIMCTKNGMKVRISCGSVFKDLLSEMFYHTSLDITA